jgi:hypothetical protein
MESHKRKLSGQGRGLVEPADMRIGREIVGKLGNSKKVMIKQTRRFGQVWTEMVVFAVFLSYFSCYWFWFCLSRFGSFVVYLLANVVLLLMLQASSSFEGMVGKAKIADVNDAFILANTMSVGDLFTKKEKKNSRKASEPLKETDAKKGRLAST